MGLTNNTNKAEPASATIETREIILEEETMLIHEIPFDELSEMGEVKKVKASEETKPNTSLFPPRSIIIRSHHVDDEATESQHPTMAPFAQLCYDKSQREVVTTIAYSCNEDTSPKAADKKKTSGSVSTANTVPVTIPSLVTTSSSSSSESMDSLSTLTECFIDKHFKGWKPPDPNALPFVLGMSPIDASDLRGETDLYLLTDSAEAPSSSCAFSARHYECGRAIRKLVGGSAKSNGGVVKRSSLRRHLSTSRLLRTITSIEGGYQRIDE